MKVSIFHDMTCKLPLQGLLEGVANLIRTDEKLAVFTRSYRQTGSKTFKNESQLFAVPVYHQYSVPTILQVVTPISFLKKISFVSF